MTQEANKLKRKQDLKKYLVFALMFAVFAGSLWLIFAPSEKERKEQEQSVGFNTELPDPRNAGIVGDKKTAYEQDMMRRKQEEKMRTLEELSFGTEKPDSTVRLSGQDEILSLDAGGTKAETASSGRTAYRGSGSFQSSTSAYRDINRTLGNFYEEPKETRKRRPCARKSRNYAIRWCSSIVSSHPTRSRLPCWRNPTSSPPNTPQGKTVLPGKHRIELRRKPTARLTSYLSDRCPFRSFPPSRNP